MMAHLLTGLRLLLAAPVAWGLAHAGSFPASWLLACVLVAIVTDYFDGIVAQRAGTASAAGQLFDHTTDFIFVTSGLLGAAVSDEVPLALPVAVTVAFAQYVIDSYWLHRYKRLRMSALGRWNGMLYFVPLVVIAVSRLDMMAFGSESWPLLVMGLSYALLVSTIASIIDRALAAPHLPELPAGRPPFAEETTGDGPA